LVFPGGFTYCAVYIRPNVFEAYIQALDRLDLDAKFLALNYVCMSESFPPLRIYLRQIHRLLSQKSSLFQKPDFKQIILRDFLPLFIRALPAQKGQRVSTKFFRRSKLVKQADDYLRSLLVGKTPERPTLSRVLSETAGFRERARLWDAKSYQTH
jgi:AraC family ethanolamine operon transcriptional activator